MSRLESAAGCCQNEHDRCESDCCPILQEKSPDRCSCGKSAQIRMHGQQRPIGRAVKKFFPARAEPGTVEVEHDGAESEKDTRAELQLFTLQTQVDKIAEVEPEEPDANQKTRKQAETAKDNFLHQDAGNQKHFRANEPEDRHVFVVARVVGWDSREHERRTGDSKHDECFAAAFRNGNLCTDKFRRSHSK